MDGFEFHSLWVLAVFLPLIAAVELRGFLRARPTVLYSSVTLVGGLPVTWRRRGRQLLPAVRIAAMVLIAFAMARPQKGLRDFRVRAEGIAIAMCLDKSGSMQALDFELDGKQVDRLAAVKAVMRDFVEGTDDLSGRPDDFIGLVAFAGYAESKTPLTLDHHTLLQVLETVQVPKPRLNQRGQMLDPEESATAIGDAVTLALDRLRHAKAKSKIVILLSDGENTAGLVEPRQAAEAAKSLGIKIYAIGVGRSGPARFPAIDRFGQAVYRLQNVRLDEATLKEMAATTGGTYFHAESTDALQRVYRKIDELEKTVVEGRLYTEHLEYYHWPLLAGLALILLERSLAATVLRTFP